MKPLVVAPSILSADFGRLADEVRAVDATGADWIRVDVMDGRFVPNISFGPVVAEVDGGQNGENAWRVVDAGADALVAGSAVFGSPDYATAIARLRQHARLDSGATCAAAPWQQLCVGDILRADRLFPANRPRRGAIS